MGQGRPIRDRYAVRARMYRESRMLVLSRKVGEKILIGDNISVTVVRVGPGVVRLGVEAPQNMTILREEIKADANSSAIQPRPSAI